MAAGWAPARRDGRGSRCSEPQPNDPPYAQTRRRAGWVRSTLVRRSCRGFLYHRVRPCRIGSSMSVRTFFAAGCAALLAACAGVGTTREESRALAIVDVTVVRPERDARDAELHDATVVIRGARIVAVGPRAR